MRGMLIQSRPRSSSHAKYVSRRSSGASYDLLTGLLRVRVSREEGQSHDGRLGSEIEMLLTRGGHSGNEIETPPKGLHRLGIRLPRASKTDFP